MKKIFFLAIPCILFYCCILQTEKPERFSENRIEVVVNRQEPYRFGSTPRLEEEFVIDLEDDAVLEIGLIKIDTFGVDTSGNIFIMNFEENQNHIFKFSRNGVFEMSFGRHGQGPGELSHPNYIAVTEENILLVADVMNAKFVYFRNDGSMLKEINTQANIPLAHPLKNGNFVVFGRLRPDPEAKYLKYPIELCNKDLQPLKTLDEFHLENPRITRRLRGTPLGGGLSISQNRIFTGNEGRGYEIWMHDLEGNLIRKIRKKYKSVPVSEKFKQEALEKQQERLRTLTYFPDDFPPFRTLFSDDEGNLFVVTFEHGEKTGESLIDVFNPDGILVGRLSANIVINPNTPLGAVARNGRMYHIREKESGFRQFVVEKIHW